MSKYSNASTEVTLLDKVSAHPKIVGTSHIVHKCKQKLTTIELYYNYINTTLWTSPKSHSTLAVHHNDGNQQPPPA